MPAQDEAVLAEGNIDHVHGDETVRAAERAVAECLPRGIDAIGYHGKMEGSTRARNQEIWMSGDVRVIVGTVAFSHIGVQVYLDSHSGVSTCRLSSLKIPSSQ